MEAVGLKPSLHSRACHTPAYHRKTEHIITTEARHNIHCGFLYLCMLVWGQLGTAFLEARMQHHMPESRPSCHDSQNYYALLPGPHIMHVFAPKALIAVQEGEKKDI
jgi:hypothetical protein